MKNTFYRTSTVESVAQRLSLLSRQAVYQLLLYYEDDAPMLEKLQAAVTMAKKIKLLRKAEEL